MKSWMNAISLIRSGVCETLVKECAVLRKTKNIYPSRDRILFALESLPFENVQVVIIGQDPYHGKGQAHGLAFSVPQGISAPPSLKNIFNEITNDIYNGKEKDFSTDLTRWAKQGVLLLNSTLTVEEGKPGSHKKLGWEALTDQIILELSSQRDHLVFMLWGAHARAKKNMIDVNKHLVLEAPHPSPLSAYRGFIGCRHFSKANGYLKQYGLKKIHW